METKNKSYIKKIGSIVGIIILAVIFNSMTKGAFASQRNLTMLLKQSAVLMILTSSLMILLIEKNIDLSGGAGVYLAGTICALMIVKAGVSTYVAIPLTIIIGIIMGSLNGFFYWGFGTSSIYCNISGATDFSGNWVYVDRLCNSWTYAF